MEKGRFRRLIKTSRDQPVHPPATAKAAITQPFLTDFCLNSFLNAPTVEIPQPLSAISPSTQPPWQLESVSSCLIWTLLASVKEVMNSLEETEKHQIPKHYKALISQAWLHEGNLLTHHLAEWLEVSQCFPNTVFRLVLGTAFALPVSHTVGSCRSHRSELYFCLAYQWFLKRFSCLWQECELSLQNQFSRTQKLYLRTCDQSSHNVPSVSAEHYFGLVWVFFFFKSPWGKEYSEKRSCRIFSLCRGAKSHAQFIFTWPPDADILLAWEILKPWSSRVLHWSFRWCEWRDSLLHCIHKHSYHQKILLSTFTWVY